MSKFRDPSIFYCPGRRPSRCFYLHPTPLETSGKLVPERTVGGQRRYNASQLMISQARQAQRKTVAYSRVSSHDQKKDLERQQEVLALYCAAKGWQYETISDLGSGMNYRKKGLRQLLDLIVSDQAGTTGHHPQGSFVAVWRGAGVCLVRDPEL